MTRREFYLLITEILARTRCEVIFEGSGTHLRFRCCGTYCPLTFAAMHSPCHQSREYGLSEYGRAGQYLGLKPEVARSIALEADCAFGHPADKTRRKRSGLLRAVWEGLHRQQAEAEAAAAE